MGSLRFSASAENDLLEAWLYVAEDSLDAADRLVDQIEAEARIQATSRPLPVVNLW